MRFIKFLVSLTLIILHLCVADTFTDQDLKFLQSEGNAIKKKHDIDSLGIVNNVNMSRAHEEAQDVYSKFMEKNPQLATQQSLNNDQSLKENSILIFVSLSLGQLELRNIMEDASKLNDATIVFRGIPKGMKFIEAINLIQSISKGIDPVPNSIINPNLFNNYNISTVPSLILLDKLSKVDPSIRYPKIKSIVHGVSDPFWLLNEFKHGNIGDFGIKGPVEEIAEPDLIEIMKLKASEIDWSKKKEDALKHFWKNQNYLNLEQATEDRTRVIDPTIQVTQDIPLPNGSFLARAGDQLNPLHIRPFTQAMIIFNAQDPKEVVKVAALAPNVRKLPSIRSIAYIATGFNKDEGWEAYKRISNQLNEPIYMLTPEIKTRFLLEKTPVVITADKDNFIVREYKP